MKMLAALFALATACSAVFAQDTCSHRGDLDPQYCDENRDMVADPPKDAKRYKNPNTLVFTYTPVEDPAVYEKIFKPFTDHLAQCTAKKVVFFQVQSNAAEIEAMRSGRLHVGGFSTGPTAFAVNIAGAVPFAVKGYEKEFQGYNLIVIVRKDSPYQKLADLKGRKVAHTAPSSNSGHMAPLALFPANGLTPDKDYKILFSGKHDSSVMGVNSPEWPTAWGRRQAASQGFTGLWSRVAPTLLSKWRPERPPEVRCRPGYCTSGKTRVDVAVHSNW